MVGTAAYTRGQINWRWLNYRIPDHWYFDFMRYLMTAAAFYILATAIQYIVRVDAKREVITMLCAINTSVAGYVILQQLEQYGKPVLVWRMPFQIVILTVIIISVHASRRAREKGEV